MSLAREVLVSIVAEVAQDPDLARDLAETLAPYLPDVREQMSRPDPASGWLDSTAAASYLGISRDALHRVTSERRIAFSQDMPGGKMFFRRSDLDSHRTRCMTHARTS